MKNAKRILCLMLALVMVLVLCACGDNSTKRDRDDDDDRNPISDYGDLMGNNPVQKTTTTTTTTTTGTREPALKRGNQVGNVCYDSALDVITADGIQVEAIDPTAYGKVTVITFWYTACSPCVVQLPAFDAIAKKYESSIKVVTVHGMLPQTAPAHIAKHYSDSPMVFLCDYIPDGDEEFDRNGYFTMLGGVDNAYPYTVVLNEKSVITHIFRTAITQEQLETAVLEALGRM